MEEKKLIRYEDVHRYASEGVHSGRLEDEDFDAIVNAIDSVPEVDAVEVVRCKGCANCCKSNWCNLLMMEVKGDWFCSHGKRRKEK